MEKKIKVGYTTGVFDLLHEGHINIIKSAREKCDYLIVGITTDELCLTEKNYLPKLTYFERYKTIECLGLADRIVPQTNIDKISACKHYNAHIVFVGNDWENTDRWRLFEKGLKSIGVKVNYFKYTENVSSSKLRDCYKDFLLTFCENKRGYIIIRYLGQGKEISIPDKMGVYPVIGLGDQSFAFNNIEAVTLGNQVEFIGVEAFYGCKMLKTINLPPDLKKIEKAAFANCTSLDEIILPAQLSELESYVFKGCKNLSKIEIPQKISRIHVDCFDFDSPCIKKKADIIFCEKWLLGTYIIEEQILQIGDNISFIADGAFMGNKKILGVLLPETIKRIGSFAFDGSGLWTDKAHRNVIYADKWAIGTSDDSLMVTELELKEDTIGIGDMAFSCARNLKRVKGIEKIKYVGRDAFKGCNKLEL